MGFVEQLCKAKAARRTTWGLRWGSSGGCDPRSHGPGGGPPESDAGGGPPGVSQSPSLCGPVGAGRAALGLPGSRARPTRSGALKPGRLGMPVAPGPDGQTRRLNSQRPGKGPGSRARPTRSASGVAFTDSPSRGRPTRSEAVEPCRLGVESRSSRARPGPTRSGVVDSR